MSGRDLEIVLCAFTKRSVTLTADKTCMKAWSGDLYSEGGENTSHHLLLCLSSMLCDLQPVRRLCDMLVFSLQQLCVSPACMMADAMYCKKCLCWKERTYSKRFPIIVPLFRMACYMLAFTSCTLHLQSSGHCMLKDCQCVRIFVDWIPWLCPAPTGVDCKYC